MCLGPHFCWSRRRRRAHHIQILHAKCLNEATIKANVCFNYTPNENRNKEMNGRMETKKCTCRESTSRLVGLWHPFIKACSLANVHMTSVLLNRMLAAALWQPPTRRNFVSVFLFLFLFSRCLLLPCLFFPSLNA